MLDPMERWREYGEKPDYAGPLTFGGVPITQDPDALSGFDVAVVGAPVDELVQLELVGADLVEVIPTGIASADPAALVGDRIVREILTGMAMRRGAAA